MVDEIMIAVVIVGIVGNLLALYILVTIHAGSNQKHRFLLMCLISNDSFALCCMFVIFAMNKHWPDIMKDLWTCRFYVMWRYFGWGSGCVAVVMAIERWLAFTKPFYYRSRITLGFLIRSVIILWFVVMCLIVAPFFGIGSFYTAKSEKSCQRLRQPKELLDVVYTYFHLTLAVIFCIIIVFTNLDVVRALNKIEDSRNDHNSFCNVRQILVQKEGRTFSWLMLSLCIAFVVCCVPQIVSVPLAQFVDDKTKMTPFYVVADMMIALNFSLDPYLYVLHQWKLIRSVFRRPTNEADNIHPARITIPRERHAV